MVALVNAQRRLNGGLPPLKRESLLDSASRSHSAKMAMGGFLAHCDPGTKTAPGERLRAAGYNWSSAAENIAAGDSTAEAVVARWMSSPGHRRNILSPEFREIGVGHFTQSDDARGVRLDTDGDCIPDAATGGPYRHYWTQSFGRRNDIYPMVINREAPTTTSRSVNLYLYGTGTATQMRLRNERAAWTDWRPFSESVDWILSPGNGLKQVEVELRSGAIALGAATDRILLEASGARSATEGSPARALGAGGGQGDTHDALTEPEPTRSPNADAATLRPR